MSTSEPGRKARTPMSTASPPLTRSSTRPLTIVPSRNAVSSTSHTRICAARSRDSRISPEPLVEALDEHVHLIAGLHGDAPLAVGELGPGDHPLRLEADVHDHVVVGDRDHRAPHHVALAQVLERLFHQLAEVVAGQFRVSFLSCGRVLLVVVLSVDHRASLAMPSTGHLTAYFTSVKLYEARALPSIVASRLRRRREANEVLIRPAPAGRIRTSGRSECGRGRRRARGCPTCRPPWPGRTASP